ncbi:type II toxin-antitoxin system Phd/YefM family antitoxin [bacterium]|nr:type II toxin-antitoxin system Phd/YefM family antitoxin [bacterium]
MKLTNIKPVSYLKAHASEILRNLSEAGGPMIITQNGEGKAVLQDISTYEQTQETLALLKILALGRKQVEAGEVHDMDAAFEEIRRNHLTDE